MQERAESKLRIHLRSVYTSVYCIYVDLETTLQPSKHERDVKISRYEIVINHFVFLIKRLQKAAQVVIIILSCL